MLHQRDFDNLLAELRLSIETTQQGIQQRNLDCIYRVSKRSERLRKRGRLIEALEICELCVDDFEGVYGINFSPLQILYFEISRIYAERNMQSRSEEMQARALSLMEQMV